MEYGGSAGSREAYPAWNAERQIPLSKEEIEDIFLDLTQKFGFQRDSMRNMVRSPYSSILLPWRFAKTSLVLTNTIRDFHVLHLHVHFFFPVHFMIMLTKKRSLTFLCNFLTVELLGCRHIMPY